MISWHRYYDPSTGRYISADPIGLAGGMNLYAYVGGNPVNAVDPEGLTETDGSELGTRPDGSVDPQLGKLMNCQSKCFLKAFIGIEEAGVGVTGALTGPFARKERRGAAGGGRAGSKTSVLSKYANSKYGKWPTKRIKRLRYLGRALGRASGLVGAVLFIYDIKIYNECMEECLKCQ